ALPAAARQPGARRPGDLARVEAVALDLGDRLDRLDAGPDRQPARRGREARRRDEPRGALEERLADESRARPRLERRRPARVRRATRAETRRPVTGRSSSPIRMPQAAFLLSL